MRDADTICALIRRSIIELCTVDHSGDETLLGAWMRDKSIRTVKAWIRQRHLFLAERLGRIIGVAGMDESGRIALNYVLPDARFSGVSKGLISALETQARERGLTRCRLESTHTALRFYKRLGYVEAEQTGVMRKGVPASLVLEKRL